MKLMQHLSAGNAPLVKISGQTTHATPGTRKEITHGLVDHNGYPVTPEIIIAQVTAADADGSNAAAAVFVVGADEEEVVVRGSAANVPFTLYVG